MHTVRTPHDVWKNGRRIWVVMEGDNASTAFATKKEAKAYRAALLAYWQMPDRRLLMSIERLHRSAVNRDGH
jgi:hypothetical protein